MIAVNSSLLFAYFDFDTDFHSEGMFSFVKDKIILDLRGMDLREDLKILHEGVNRIGYWSNRRHDMWLSVNGKFGREKLAQVDLEGADLRGVEFPAHSDLSNIRNLDKAELEGATYLFMEKFPEGFNPEAHGMINRYHSTNSMHLINCIFKKVPIVF